MNTRAAGGKRRSSSASTQRGAEIPELAPDVVRATAAFRASLRRFERTSERIGLEGGLTLRRYLPLMMITGAPDGSERATVGDLPDRLQLEQHTVTELVARAEDAGLIRRERSADDGRVCYLRLTGDNRSTARGAGNGWSPASRGAAASASRLSTVGPVASDSC